MNQINRDSVNGETLLRLRTGLGEVRSNSHKQHVVVAYIVPAFLVCGIVC